MIAWIQLGAYVALVVLLVLFTRIMIRVFCTASARIAASFDQLAETLGRVLTALARLEARAAPTSSTPTDGDAT